MKIIYARSITTLVIANLLLPATWISAKDQAPFAGLSHVNTSRDNRSVFFQLRASGGESLVPGHANAYRLQSRASLHIHCRIPGPETAGLPDPGGQRATLIFPDHPSQPDAWSILHPMTYISGLLGFDKEKTPVRITLPDGTKQEDGELIRYRTSYGSGATKLQIHFDAVRPGETSILDILNQASHGEQLTILIEGKEKMAEKVRIVMHFIFDENLAPALKRMKQFCPPPDRSSGAN